MYDNDREIICPVLFMITFYLSYTKIKFDPSFTTSLNIFILMYYIVADFHKY